MIKEHTWCHSITIAAKSEWLQKTDIDLLVTIADAFSTFILVPCEALHAWTEKAHLFLSLTDTRFIQTKSFSLWFSLLWKYILG